LENAAIKLQKPLPTVKQQSDDDHLPKGIAMSRDLSGCGGFGEVPIAKVTAT